METLLGGIDIAVGKMKDSRYTHWVENSERLTRLYRLWLTISVEVAGLF